MANLVDTADAGELAALPLPGRRRGAAARSRTRLLAICAGGAAVSLLSQVSPTGLTEADRLWCAGFFVATALFASVARRWTWLVAAAAAAITASSWTWFAVAAVAGVCVAAGAHRRVRSWGALAAIASLAALTHQTGGPFGRSALVTLIAVLPIYASGIRRCSRRCRRRVLVGSALGIVISGSTLAYVGQQALSTRADLERSLSALDDDLDGILRAEDADARARLIRNLGEAQTSLNKARTQFDGPLTRLTRALPVVGHYTRAANYITTDSYFIVADARELAQSFNLDTLRVESGRIPTEQLDRLEPPLSSLSRRVTAAERRLLEIDNGWIATPLRNRIAEGRSDIAELRPALEVAAAAAQNADALFGVTSPQRYLVLFTTPAEARGSNGLVGNYSEIVVRDGQISISEVHRVEDLNRTLRALPPTPITQPQQFVDRYGRFSVDQFFQDVTLSPHFPYTAEVAEHLYRRAGKEPVNGVILIDPFALAGLLNVTGPITLQSGLRLDSRSAVDYLMRDQYAIENDRTRVDQLSEATSRTIVAFLGNKLPAPMRLYDVLAPLVNDRHVVLYNKDSSIQSIFRRMGASGELREGLDEATLGVFHENSGQNKIDAYLERTTRYEFTVGDTGAATGIVTVELTNTAPASGLPSAVIGSNDQGLAPGTNKMLLSLYSPWPLRSATLDGRRIATESGREADLFVYSAWVTLPAGGRASVVWEVASTDADPRYRSLVVLRQTLARPETTEVVVRTSESEQRRPATGAATRLPLDEAP